MTDELKDRIFEAVEAAQEEVIVLAKFLHANPEIAMEEFAACKRCVDLLEGYGFRVERGVAGLPTAFRAQVGGGEAPRVALLAEYDALPGVGHGCGHNLIAGAISGAAIALASVMDRVEGTVVVFGTPGEEGKGGKIYMVNAGSFADIDAVLATHPHPSYASVPTEPGSGRSLAAMYLTIEFFGQKAHAARDPHNGINALNALIEAFNGINALRQHMKASARIHGIITESGEAPNVVPDYSKGTFVVRTETRAELPDLVDKVEKIAQGAALITGAKLKFTRSERPYDDMVPNYVLARRLKANFDAVGLHTAPPRIGPGLASSDLGNVSHLVPTAGGSFPICDEVIPWHSPQAAEACNTERAYRAMIAAAKGIALTALEVLTDEGLLRQAKAEFQAAVSGYEQGEKE